MLAETPGAGSSASPARAAAAAAAAAALASASDAGDAATAPGVSLADLPPAVLASVVARCWAAAPAPSRPGEAAADGGPASVWALSRTCRALRAACDAALAQMDELPPAPLAALRGEPLPPPARAAALVARLIRQLAGVRVIDLSGLHFWVHDACLEAIGASCPRLETLKCAHCQHITGDGLASMVGFGRLTALRALDIRSCGDVGGGAFLRHLPALTSLDAAYCRSLEPEQLLAVCSRLRRLGLQGCERVGDEVCGRLPSATSLDLSFLPLTDAGLAALVGGSPRLRELTLAEWRRWNLWGAGRFTEAGVDELRRRVPGLVVSLAM